MNDEPLNIPAAELGIDLPDEKPIVEASEIASPLDRTRALYQLCLRYRELAAEALDRAKGAASDANARGVTFKAIADHAGCKAQSSLARTRRPPSR